MATMSKAELLESVSGSSGVTRSQAESVLSQFFSTVTEAAKRGDKAGWPGFGTFSSAQRGARTGRNPRTGEPVQIAASTAIKFSPSSTLKQAMNAGKATKKSAAAKSTAKSTKKSSGTTTKAAAKKSTSASKSTGKKATGTKAAAKKR